MATVARFLMHGSLRAVGPKRAPGLERTRFTSGSTGSVDPHFLLCDAGPRDGERPGVLLQPTQRLMPRRPQSGRRTAPPSPLPEAAVGKVTIRPPC
jgi:hypothetical protein